MIKHLKELEAIKAKMIASMYLRSANPKYKVTFHYNDLVKNQGIDELIDYLISSLIDMEAFDIVVLKTYNETLSTITLTVTGKNGEYTYTNVTKIIIDKIIAHHLQQDIVLHDFLLQQMEDLA